MPLIEELFKTKVSSKGQVVIPKRLREAFRMDEGEEILMIPTEAGVLLRRVEKTSGLRGLLRELDVDTAECEAILAEAERSLTKVV